MKTQCPECSKIFDAPEHYKDKKVKCPKCQKLFVATIYQEPVYEPTLQPDSVISPHKENPILNESGTETFLLFIGTLGIIGSILSCIFCFIAATQKPTDSLLTETKTPVDDIVMTSTIVFILSCIVLGVSKLITAVREGFHEQKHLRAEKDNNTHT